MQCGDFPHLLVYGPSGAGKKTRIMCLLRELYGAGVEKLRIEHQTFTTPSKKKIEISTIASNYHIEVNPRYFTHSFFYLILCRWCTIMCTWHNIFILNVVELFILLNCSFSSSSYLENLPVLLAVISTCHTDIDILHETNFV